MRKLMMAVVVVLLVYIGSARATVTIDWVTVGNAGNANDVHGDGYGGVAYEYQISKYEVTTGQYTEFLNAVAATDPHGLYNMEMWSDSYGCKIQRNDSSGSYSYSAAPDWANRPVNWVSWYDALRFSNWMHNGQGAGDTEDGAYDMSLGSSAVHKAGARVRLPSEDEWYKAAYHKNDGITGNYYDYPTGSDTAPSNDLIDPDPGNNATFYNSGYTIGSPYYRTEVGAHENSDGPYGTFDMGGNAFEWNEGQIGSIRVFSGGSWDVLGVDYLSSSYRTGALPVSENATIGFRVASEVPEPATLLLLGLGGLALRKRKA